MYQYMLKSEIYEETIATVENQYNQHIFVGIYILSERQITIWYVYLVLIHNSTL